MIEKISDKDAQDILNDDVKYRLFVCESILMNLKTNFPLRTNYDTLVLETYLETLLFFMVSVQDALMLDITDWLGISRRHDINIHLIRKKLNPKNYNQKVILEIIDKNFSKPFLKEKNISKETYDQIQQNGNISEKVHLSIKNRLCTQKYWFRDKSRLWEIRRLRNQVTHSTIITTNTYLGSIEKVTMIIKMTNNTKEIPQEFVEEENVQKYFYDSLALTKQFVSDIRKNTWQSVTS